jgi:hypothetical protein
MTKVTGYKLGSWNIIPGMDKIISLYHPIQSGSRASLSFYPMLGSRSMKLTTI